MTRWGQPASCALARTWPRRVRRPRRSEALFWPIRELAPPASMLISPPGLLGWDVLVGRIVLTVFRNSRQRHGSHYGLPRQILNNICEPGSSVLGRSVLFLWAR